MPFLAAPAALGIGSALSAAGGLASAGTSIGMAADQISKQNAAIARNQQKQAARNELMQQFNKTTGPLGEPVGDQASSGPLGPPGWLPDVTKKNQGF